MGEARAMVESLLDLAREEANGLIRAAREQADRRLADARKEAEARAAAIGVQAERRAALEERRVATEAELAFRGDLLRAKVGLLDEAFAAAYRVLTSLPDEEWRALVGRILLESVATGTERITVPAGQTAKFATLLASVNGQLKALGNRGELRLAEETAAIESGFILTAESYAVDCSFRTLLAERRPALEPDVARVLFAAD